MGTDYDIGITGTKFIDISVFIITIEKIVILPPVRYLVFQSLKTNGGHPQ